MVQAAKVDQVWWPGLRWTGFGGPGFGGPGGFGPPVPPVMSALDKDGDGEISAEELAGAPAALKSLDKNKDGVLKDDEIIPPMMFGPGGPGGANRELVKKFDKDGDGRLNDAERAEARKEAAAGGGGRMGGRAVWGAAIKSHLKPASQSSPRK